MTGVQTCALPISAAYKDQTKGFKPDSYGSGTTPPPSGPKGSGGPSKGLTFDSNAPETKVGTPEADLSNARRDTARSLVQPSSVAENVKDANVDVARGLYDAVDKDKTGGKVANAVYGTDRADALAADALPEIGHADGTVKAKVSNPDGVKQLADIRAQVPDELLHFKDHDGLTQYTDNEIAKTSNWKVNDLESAIAMNPRPEMFQLQPGTKNLADTSTGFTIRGMYGPMNHGYSNPKEAMELANYALRNTGIPDADIILMKRVGGKYVPTTLEKEAGKFDPGFSVVMEDSGIKSNYNDGRYAEAIVKGGKIRLVGAIHGDSGARTVTAFNEQGKEVGSVLYGQGLERIENPNVRVNKDNQGRGIANAMYDYAEKHGAQFPSSDTQLGLRSEAGQAFRDARASGKLVKHSFGDGDYLIGIDHNYNVTPQDFKKARVLKDGLHVYHGTEADTIHKFNDGLGIGPHFGTKEQASKFVGKSGKILPITLNLNKSLRLPDGGWENPSLLVLKLVKAGIMKESEMMGVVPFRGKASTTPELKTDFDNIKKFIKSKGYDSIVYKNIHEGEGDSYIALSSSKQVIKGHVKVETDANASDKLTYKKIGRAHV